jgi:class 3 adenylate cyclase
MRIGELVYGLVIAVDIENFSRLDTLAQSSVQARLSRVLDMAASRACLERTKWHRQLRGDGELAVLPPDTDVAWVVADFPHQIGEELKDGGHPRLRLRMAMHYGTLTAGDFGPVGDAPIVACRLLDARSTRRVLAAEPDSDVVLVVSQRLFEDVVTTRFHGLCPERFRQMKVSAKKSTYTGYLCVGSPRALTSDPVEP